MLGDAWNREVCPQFFDQKARFNRRMVVAPNAPYEHPEFLVDQVEKAGGVKNRSTHGPTLGLGKEDVCPHVAGTSAANLGSPCPSMCVKDAAGVLG